MASQRFLIIQTAFLGDAILATGLLEKLHAFFPDAKIDMLIRKGNESIFNNHPYLNELLIWDKKPKKWKNLFRILGKIRAVKYDKVINVQRFFSTGLITAFSGAKETIGFDKNPLQFLFTKKIKHEIGITDQHLHETQRNHRLISAFTDNNPAKPVLYPLKIDIEVVQKFKSAPYITISPASVWFTKQFPAAQWIELINNLHGSLQVYLMGSPDDRETAEHIKNTSGKKNITNLCGEIGILQAAALMQDAKMNYVNDSAPLHIASSVNAPVAAVFCSTIPAFGFTPLSDKSIVIETSSQLSCRPCGLHGKKACPEGHFNCAKTITTDQLLSVLN